MYVIFKQTTSIYFWPANKQYQLLWNSPIRNISFTHNGLDPMHGPCPHPHQVAWLLDEAVHGNVFLIQVLEDGPPGAGQVVHIVPTTQVKYR